MNNLSTGADPNSVSFRQSVGLSYKTLPGAACTKSENISFMYVNHTIHPLLPEAVPFLSSYYTKVDEIEIGLSTEKIFL